MQRNESETEIFVYLVDETYDVVTDWDEEEVSSMYLRGLEAEFDTSFEAADVAPGASLPAFLTVISENIIPLLPWLMAVFFSAKPVKENLGVWQEAAKQIRRYWHKCVVLSRNGAAVVAVDAVFREIKNHPKAIELKRYWTSDKRFDEKCEVGGEENSISSTPPTEYLSVTKHHFEIVADTVTFKIVVDGKNISIVSSYAGKT